MALERRGEEGRTGSVRGRRTGGGGPLKVALRKREEKRIRRERRLFEAEMRVERTGDTAPERAGGHPVSGVSKGKGKEKEANVSKEDGPKDHLSDAEKADTELSRRAQRPSGSVVLKGKGKEKEASVAREDTTPKTDSSKDLFSPEDPLSAAENADTALTRARWSRLLSGKVDEEVTRNSRAVSARLRRSASKSLFGGQQRRRPSSTGERSIPALKGDVKQFVDGVYEFNQYQIEKGKREAAKTLGAEKVIIGGFWEPEDTDTTKAVIAGGLVVDPLRPVALVDNPVRDQFCQMGSRWTDEELYV